MVRVGPAIGILLLAGSLAVSRGAAQGAKSPQRAVAEKATAAPSSSGIRVTFTDVAKAAGLNFKQDSTASDQKLYLETMGTGVAWIDYDQDGLMDLFFVQSAATDLYQPPHPLRCALYHNNGDGTFTDVTRAAGLYREGTFWGSACTFVDYDRDGHLDLFVGHYGYLDLAKTPPPGGDATHCMYAGIPVFCGPHYFQPVAPMLFHNNGDGTFTDVSVASGIGASAGTRAMTAVAADFDNDGWPDIYVACDGAPSLFFRNNRDGTFVEDGIGRGVALSDDGFAQAGMGLGIGDLNLDGSLDIFKTHYAGDTNIVYRNDGKGFFDDLTSMAGLAVETRYIGWGAGIVDLDNDGLPDMYAVTGGTYPGLAKQLPRDPWKTPRFIFRNLGNGRFEELIDEAGPGFGALHCSRGSAMGDFDNDGDMDIVVVNLNEPPSLLRNDLKTGSGSANWLKVKLIGTKSNRSAIGSRVTLHYGDRVQAQEVLAQSSFYSSDDRRLHFGLGKEREADLTVRWTNGLVEKISSVEANRMVTIREGSGIVKSEKWK